MGIPFNTGASLPERTDRFIYLMNRPEFICPENDFIATTPPASTPTFPATQWNSYDVAVVFMYKSNYLGTNSDTAGWDMGQVGETYSLVGHNPPSGYIPKITKIGDAARKVYIACGGKYTNASTPPSMPLTLKFDYGGAFGDRGPWYTANTGFGRQQAPGNGGTGAPSLDTRIYAYRHGNRTPYGASDTYKNVVGFYDGHVETMGDLQGADPRMWMPKGSFLNMSNLFADVKAAFYPGFAGTSTVIEN
jgi:hypothetical protein